VLEIQPGYSTASLPTLSELISWFSGISARLPFSPVRVQAVAQANLLHNGGSLVIGHRALLQSSLSRVSVGDADTPASPGPEIEEFASCRVSTTLLGSVIDPGMMIEYINSDHNTDLTSRRMIEKLEAKSGKSGKIGVVFSFLLPYAVSGPFTCSIFLAALQHGPDAAFDEATAMPSIESSSTTTPCFTTSPWKSPSSLLS